MKNEKVLLNEWGGGQVVMPARSIVIPDVRYLALYLEDETMHNVVIWSYQSAMMTLDRVLQRQRWNCVKEPFQIDVPDLYNVAQKFPKQEREELMDFWAKYRGIVKHFLPKAIPKTYYFEGNVKGGVRYHGMAWFTKGDNAPSLFDK